MTTSAVTRRALSAIVDEIHVALKRETADVIVIGGLLIEAKAQLKHGQWYSWLEKEFSLSRQSADRYIKVNKFASKTPSVGDLKLQVSALYVLADVGGYGSAYSKPGPKEIEAILLEAKDRWVGEARAKDIIWAIRRSATVDDEQPEPEPRPVPPPAPLPRDKYLAEKFALAVRELIKLTTKPSAKFVGLYSSIDLELVANFLNQIAAGSKARAA
jgi:hypothetical protein